MFVALEHHPRVDLRVCTIDNETLVSRVARVINPIKSSPKTPPRH